MPTDKDALQWVEVADFSPGIWDPRGTILNSRNPDPASGSAGGAPLGAAQIWHAEQTVSESADGPQDVSGNANHGTWNPNPEEITVNLGRPGLVSGDTGAGVTNQPAAGYLASVPIEPLTFHDDFWINCWFIADSTSHGGRTLFSTAQSLSIPEFHWEVFPTGYFEFTRQWGADVGVDVETATSGPDTLTDGPHMATVKYDSGTHVFTFYVDGAVHGSTYAGVAQTNMALDITTALIAFNDYSDALLIADYDEFAWGSTSPITGAILDLYDSASVSFAAYTATQLAGAFAPTGYYHLNEGEGITRRPGTYRCVCVPGKGLYPAPRRIPAANVTLDFDDITDDPDPEMG